jgi:ABC-type polar amino acid transport system ATPase subunit
LAELRRRHIGFVFQTYNLFPTLTAEENVRLALDVRGNGRRSAIHMARTALTSVGLGHKLRSYPRNMSGGEQQRVAIARALAGAPSLILADEPTAALDSENGQGVMVLLADIAKRENRAVLAVTHDPRTLPYADRIIRIEDGVIVGEKRQKVKPSAMTNVANGKIGALVLFENAGRKLDRRSAVGNRHCLDGDADQLGAGAGTGHVRCARGAEADVGRLCCGTSGAARRRD